MRLLNLLGLLVLLNSCITINTPGLYNGYKKLTDDEKQRVTFLDTDSNIETLENNGEILAINGIQLREYLQKNDSVIVYLWGPHCLSESCILISACQEYSASNNYKLVVVADYYDMEIMDAQNVGDLPMFIPNHVYYKKYFANSLNRLFIKDVLQTNSLTKDEQYNRFFLFNRGELIDCRKNLFDQ